MTELNEILQRYGILVDTMTELEKAQAKLAKAQAAYEALLAEAQGN